MLVPFRVKKTVKVCFRSWLRCDLQVDNGVFLFSQLDPPQLQSLIQIWSILAPKKQDDNGHNAKFLKNCSPQTNGMTSQWFHNLLAPIV